MVDIAKLTASIQQHEGLRLNPYIDSTGHSTIGYGHNLAGGITQNAANFILSEDIAVSQTACESQVWWDNVSGDDVRSRAIIEMVFNMGLGGLLTFRQAIAALAAGDFAAAADQFEQSKWYGQVGKRAVTLTEMIRTGLDPDESSTPSMAQQ